jgi:hypothetical protein
MTHRTLLIVPSAESASATWTETGIGNWAAAFPLRLERAGLLDSMSPTKGLWTTPASLPGADC